MAETIQDRKPNFRDDEGNLYLVRCYACDPEYGRENWAMAVATGQCCWCRWSEATKAMYKESEVPVIQESESK